MIRSFILVISVSCLAACGGGGGAEGGVGSLPLQVSLTPTELRWSQFHGKKRDLLVRAEVIGEVFGPVVIVIKDNSGVIQNIQVSGEAESYAATITTRANLALGSHRGNFEVHLCSSTACSQRYGRASLTYDVDVVSESATDLRALSPIAGISDWSSDHGGPARTGFLPITVDAEKFNGRWLWSSGEPPGYGVRISAVISSRELGLGFVHRRSSDGSSGLVALRESDGTEAWNISTPASGAPSLDGYRLFAAGTISDTAARLLAYDAATGSVLIDATGPKPGGDYPSAPAISNGSVFVNYGASGDTLARTGQVLSFNASSGSYLWSSATGGYANVAPAADVDQVYFYRPNSSFSNLFPDGFTAVSANNGSTTFTVSRPAAGPGQMYYNGGTPVIDGAGGVVVSAGAQFGFVDRYDLSTRTLKWSIPAERTTPVVAGDTVYVGTNGGFEARALADGTLRWSWRPEDHGVSAYSTFSMAATTNVVFVGTDKEVAAVDVATQKTVWTYPQPGNVSLSASGLLYISRLIEIPGGSIVWDGGVAAINLR